MVFSDMGDFDHQSIVDPNLLTNSDDPSSQASSSDDLFNFDIPGADVTDAPEPDATFDFDGFDLDQQAVQGVGSAIPSALLSSLSDQRYVSFSSPSQTHPSSIWRPLEQPLEQFNYPDPEIFSQPPMAAAPYYPLQPLPSANTMAQLNFRAITPPGQQFMSIDQPLFLHGNMGPSPATAGTLQYEPIQAYQDNGAFNPEDLAFSSFAEDLAATAVCEGWTLPDDAFAPDTSNDSDFEGYKPFSSARAKRPRRNNTCRSKAILPNGEVKKGRPCAKPQTEERRRINERRMEGYYRRKYEQGNLEKARQQSKESYWRRKQRRIEAGEKVRSYNASKDGRVSKRL